MKISVFHYFSLLSTAQTLFKCVVFFLGYAVSRRLLSLKKFKGAKLFGLTTGLAVMKINTELGYHPVTFSQLTNEEEFWAGCKSCVNYPILESKERQNCLCTAMLFDPEVDYITATLKPKFLFEMMEDLANVEPIDINEL